MPGLLLMMPNVFIGIKEITNFSFSVFLFFSWERKKLFSFLLNSKCSLFDVSFNDSHEFMNQIDTSKLLSLMQYIIEYLVGWVMNLSKWICFYVLAHVCIWMIMCASVCVCVCVWINKKNANFFLSFEWVPREISLSFKYQVMLQLTPHSDLLLKPRYFNSFISLNCIITLVYYAII